MAKRIIGVVLAAAIVVVMVMAVIESRRLPGVDNTIEPHSVNMPDSAEISERVAVPPDSLGE